LNPKLYGRERERDRKSVWVCERKIENEFGEEEAVVWGREGEKNENGLREEEEEVVVMFFFETDLMLQLLNFLLFHVKMLFCSFLFSNLPYASIG
jgi:hypothetical protein